VHGLPFNETMKLEIGKTHFLSGPRARTGWRCQEGPEEGWGRTGCGGLVVSMDECKHLGRYPMCLCQRGGDVRLCQGVVRGAPRPPGGGLVLSPYVFSPLLIRIRSGLGHMHRPTCGAHGQVLTSPSPHPHL